MKCRLLSLWSIATLLLVFGGCNEDDPDDVDTQGTGDVGVDTAGEGSTDADGLIVAELAYGDAGDIEPVTDQSLTRNADLTGGFTAHLTATGADGAIFSPGTRIDGSSF